MNTNLDCIYCVIRKADERYSKFGTDDSKKLLFMREVFNLVGNADPKLPTPYLSMEIMDLIKKHLSDRDFYADLKHRYNNLMLECEDEIFGKINKSEDPLLAALLFAMTGNFIDFAAHSDISPEKLTELLENSGTQNVDTKEYSHLCKELKSAKNLVYLCDNAGEIVLDKLFIKTIKRLYKDLNITVVVRGGAIFNDITLDDAKEVGLDKVVPTISSGAGVPGTYLPSLNGEAKKACDNADVIISKGQGNFETLYGCKKNIYYIFLCKCPHFTKLFNVLKLTGMFVNENRISFDKETR